MPAVVLLLIWWKRGRLTSRDLAAVAPFFVIGIGMAALTAWMERTQVGARGPEWEAITLAQRVLIAGRAIWFYVEKILAPVKLSFIYPRWNIAAAPATWWVFPAAVVVVAAVLFALRQQHRPRAGGGVADLLRRAAAGAGVRRFLSDALLVRRRPLPVSRRRRR